MTESTKLEDLQPGDRAVITDRSGPARIVTVERVTKTQIVIDKNVKFNRRTGWLVGADTWDPSRIKPLTESRVRAVRLRKARAETRSCMSLAETEIRKLHPDPAVVAAHLKTAAVCAAEWMHLSQGGN